MAYQTSAALQTSLNTAAGGKAAYRILRDTKVGDGSTYRMYYTVSLQGGNKAGKACWCRTTVANSLGDQRDEIEAAILATGQVDANL